MFRLTNINGRSAFQFDDGFVDVAKVAGDESLADPMNAIARFGELSALYAKAGASPKSSGTPGVCVPKPAKVFGIGLNYKSHAAESNMELPPAPLTFTKFPSCLAGPTADVELSGDMVDWEVEIVVVIGKGGRHIAESAAWSHVAGLTLGQDISDRKVQLGGKPPQFSLGKSFDTYGPIGPAIVSVDAFPNRDDIALWCDVSGERMQEARTSNLIFTIPYLVSYLSSICTLESGDVIFTGTPDGVGMARGRLLKAGDVIDSGADVIGALRNVCVAGK
ncbi:MAG: fumarylacetoacetate hydrolase [Acidimicrobiales bacterium mtb01]|nr:fumarylacetoacetate hydrolase family protein [Actinomycetota bacterium]TEX47316.1 MAG: fumarylacetoacetate hydrolase [Acidimicrobiales bacterium mtb01]